jgi:hypothetical protein
MILTNLKSTVDWCEENYAVTEYIVEFWNSITFFPILFSAIYWRRSFPRLFVFDKLFHHVFWYLVLVSLGTALFHGTLLYKFQLLDELPMVLVATKYISILMSLNQIVIVRNSFLNDLVNLFMQFKYTFIYLIVISYFLNPNYQIALFHGSLKLYESIIFILIYKLQKKLKIIISYNPIFHIYKNKISYHARMGLIFYAIAGLLWVSENLFCEYLQHLQFHAFWHIFSSMGIYHLNSVISYSYLINNIIYFSR